MLRRTGKNQGFTLVELLVVIGIIALLLSILMPSLAKAKDAANSINCASNLRQMGQGIMLYTQDAKGLLPMFVGWQRPWGAVNQTWAAQICDQLNIQFVSQTRPQLIFSSWAQMKLFRCPADDSYKSLGNTPRIDFGTGMNPGWGQYGINGLGTSWFANFRVLATNHQYMSGTDGGSWSEIGWVWGHPLHRFKDVAGKLVLTEKLASSVPGGGGLVGDTGQWTLIGDGWYGGGNYSYFAAFIPNTVYGHHRRTSSAANLGMANVLFLDGHVELLDVKQIIAPAQNIIAANPTTSTGATGQAVIDANQQYWGGYGH